MNTETTGNIAKVYEYDKNTEKKTLMRIEDQDGWRWYAKSHDHYLAGECYISVTKAMDHLVADKMQNYFKKNSAAKQTSHLNFTADIGTRIHKVIEDDLSGLPPLLEADTREPYKQWCKLKHENKISARDCEIQLYSDELGAAGTADIIGWYQGKLAVMDVKTGFYSVKAGFQMAAYRHMSVEMGICDNDVGMVGLQVKRDGSGATAFEYQHYDWCLKSFVAAIESFKAMYYTKLDKMKWKFLHLNSMDVLYKNNKSNKGDL